MAVSTIDGILKAAELKKVRQNVRVYSRLVFTLADGSEKTVEKAIVQTNVAEKLEPGARGRFYCYQAIDHRGLHGLRLEDGTAVYGYSKLNERAMLVTFAVGIVLGFLYIGLLDRISLWVPILLILGGGGYALYRGTRQQAERQFATDNPGVPLAG